MLRRLTLVTLVLAPAAAAALALAHPVAAQAAPAHHPLVAQDQGGNGEDCSIAISMAPMSPSMTYVPGQATYKMSGFADCMSTSAQAMHGTFTGAGSGMVGCSGALREATLNFVWNDGKTSTEHLQFGEFLYGGGAFGSVNNGEFNGSSVGMALERRGGGGELLCVTGLPSYGMAGEMAILGSGGGSGGGGGGGNGGGDNGGAGNGSPSSGNGASAGGAAGAVSAAAVPPGTGSGIVKASASTPTTGTSVSPAIPATGVGAVGLVTGISLLGLGAAVLTRSVLASR